MTFYEKYVPTTDNVVDNVLIMTLISFNSLNGS